MSKVIELEREKIEPTKYSARRGNAAAWRGVDAVRVWFLVKNLQDQRRERRECSTWYREKMRELFEEAKVMRRGERRKRQ